MSEVDDYVGMTVHWTDPETGEREDGVVEDVGPHPYFWIEDGPGVPVQYLEEITYRSDLGETDG